MMVKISEVNLTIMKKSFSEIESKMLPGVVETFPGSAAVFEHDYTWTICGSKERLFDCLLILSNQFDVEIV